MKNGSVEFAVAPEAEAIAIGVDQVREGLKLRPLLFVVRVAEAAGISSLARRLYLDETNQGVFGASRRSRAAS